MEPQDRKEIVKARVEGYINELLAEVQQHVASSLPGGVLPDSVVKWWTMHYRAKFYYAVDYKGVVWDDSKSNLMSKARELGEALVRYAEGKAMTRVHAARASFDVDCLEGAQLEWDWCN